MERRRRDEDDRQRLLITRARNEDIEDCILFAFVLAGHRGARRGREGLRGAKQPRRGQVRVP